jgi:hypothetical protein
MKKISEFLLLAASTLTALALIACSGEEKARKAILSDTPIGMSFSQVISFCSKNQLKCSFSYTAGYLDQRTGKVVGVKSIWTVLNEYNNSPITISSSSVYWGFDKDDKLIDIWVWKTIDAP